GRSGLARHHAGDEFADLLHASAAWADAVLLARRRPARDHHAAYICRNHSLRAHSTICAGGVVVRPGARDLAAAQALWAVDRGSRSPHERSDMRGVWATRMSLRSSGL